jgi:hypothetical protein
MLRRHVQRQTHGDTEIRRRPARIGAPTHGPLPSKPLAGQIAAIDLLIGGIRPLWARASRGRASGRTHRSLRVTAEIVGWLHKRASQILSIRSKLDRFDKARKVWIS